MEIQKIAIRERLGAIPMVPGVYLFRNSSGQILYIGKAINLRHRLRSYFGKQSNLPSKIQQMMKHLWDFEFYVTHSDNEALLLENTLIKRHRPHYNSRLRDDKTYPYIKIDLNEKYPLVYFTRRVEADGARYFGPFASARSVRRTLALLKRLFPYRSCTKPITGTEARPCLEYSMHRCVAPCVGYSSQEDYRKVISQVILFLEGKTKSVTRELHKRMNEASGSLEFERAARIRDQIAAIQHVSEKQQVVSPKARDLDAVGMASSQDEAWVEVFFIRKGKLVGRDHFIMEGVQDEEPAQILTTFIKQFYDTAPFIPPTLLLQYPLQEATLLRSWLESKRGGRVIPHTPQRGERLNLIRLVAENAAQGLKAQKTSREAADGAIQRGMRDLQEALSLPRLPRRIECYDVSNIQGSDVVGSMVVCESGKPKPAEYRRFKIRNVQGIDDYSCMQEMLYRRFSRLVSKHEDALHTPSPGGEISSPHNQDRWGKVPDLVLIDGGKGHLSAALEVFLNLGISTEVTALASLAKEREELFLTNMPEPILLPRNSPALHMVQRARDEAHRFAITYHRKLRSRRQTRSVLDNVAGVGQKRKALLLQRFGSIKNVREASIERLTSVPGINQATAQRLKETLLRNHRGAVKQ